MIFNGKTMTAHGTFVHAPATVDDGHIGGNVWTSKGTVDHLCPAIEESGAVVRCEPLEGYPLGVISKVGPSLDFYTGITLTRCGKNLYDEVAFPLSTGMINKDTGVATGGSKCSRTAGFIPIAHLHGKTITLNHPAKGTYGPAGAAFYDEDQIYISGSNEATMVVPDNAEYMRFCVPKAYMDQIQIELGSTVTDYEPYAGKTYTVALDDACYGGSFDWRTGLLTVTHKSRALWTLDWQYSEDNCYFYADLPDAAAGAAICSHLTQAPGRFDDITSGGYGADEPDCVFDISDGAIAVIYNGADNVEDFLSEITDLEVMLVYPLAVPETRGILPQVITAKAGTNLLYSSTGDTQIMGRADALAIIAKLETALASALERITKLEQAYPIKFELMGVTYTATNGQSWAEYIERLDEYDCPSCGTFYKQFCVSGGKVYYNEGCGNVDICGSMSYPLAADGVQVSADDLIMADFVYETA